MDDRTGDGQYRPDMVEIWPEFGAGNAPSCSKNPRA